MKTHMDAEDWAAFAGDDRWSPVATGTHRLDGLAHRIVWSVPQEAFAHGYQEDGEDGDLSDHLVEAVGSARAEGGAWLWVIVRDDRDQSVPLSDGAHDIAAIHVLTRAEVRPLGSWNSDLESPDWGRPVLLQVAPRRGSLYSPPQAVHISRLCYIPGARAVATEATGGDDIYDHPVLALYRDGISDMTSAWDSTRKLTHNRATPWMRLSTKSANTTDLAGHLAMRAAAIARMWAKSMFVLGTDDEIGWAAPPIAGTAEVVMAAALRVSAPEGVPITRFFGTSPGGLSTDDEAGRRAWESLIDRTRASVEPALLQVWHIRYGADSKDPVIEWPPVSTPDPEATARTQATMAQRDLTLLTAQAITADEVRARIEATGEVPLLPDPEWTDG